jgi:hypothetical protein
VDLGGGLKAVRVTLHELLDGDADLDGAVGRDDFLALRTGFGSVGDWFSGDFNFDGEVDFLDYVALKQNWGDSLADEDGVPEPATLVLLGVGALAAIRRRTARQQ